MPEGFTDQRWADFVSFRADTVARLTSLEKQSAVEGVHRQNVETRLSAIEDTLKWLVRLLLGGIIAAIVSFAMSGGFSIGV